MDRIDKFLNRRKQKNKRVMKLNNKYYEITKEDIKMVRSYKKNVCLDSTVDMYIPYKLDFTKDKFENPVNFTITGNKIKNEETESKKYIKKNDYNKQPRKIKNELRDIWIDDTEDYEQNIIYDIKEQYTDNISDLRLTEENLAKEIRKTYLRQYLPRERKTLKISDIIKNQKISEDVEYPQKIAKKYTISGKVAFDIENERIVCYKDNKMQLYELKNFYKVLETSFENKDDTTKVTNDAIESKDDTTKVTNDAIETKYENKEDTIKVENKISKVEIKDKITVLCKGSSCNKIYSLDYKTNSCNEIARSKKIINFSCDKYNFIMTNRSVVLWKINATNTKSMQSNEKDFDDKKLKLPLHKVDKLTNIVTKENLLFITSSNSIQIYDINKKCIINHSQTFSYIVDFVFSDNILFIINNLRKIIIFDYQKNIVIHTMDQDLDLLGISYSKNCSLLAVTTVEDILIFYANIFTSQYKLLNRIKGKHGCVHFDKQMPWIYATKDHSLFMYT